MYHVGINHIIQIFFLKLLFATQKRKAKKWKFKKKNYDQFFQVSFPTGYEL